MQDGHSLFTSPKMSSEAAPTLVVEAMASKLVVGLLEAAANANGQSWGNVITIAPPLKNLGDFGLRGPKTRWSGLCLRYECEADGIVISKFEVTGMLILFLLAGLDPGWRLDLRADFLGDLDL